MSHEVSPFPPKSSAYNSTMLGLSKQVWAVTTVTKRKLTRAKSFIVVLIGGVGYQTKISVGAAAINRQQLLSGNLTLATWHPVSTSKLTRGLWISCLIVAFGILVVIAADVVIGGRGSRCIHAIQRVVTVDVGKVGVRAGRHLFVLNILFWKPQ